MTTRAKIQGYLRNILYMFLTILLSPIFYLGVFFNRIKSREERFKILVIQRGKIGDLVCTTGVFKLIKEKYPDSYLAVLATNYASDIIANNPHLDQIIRFEEKRRDIGYLINIINKIRREKFYFSISSQPHSSNSIIALWSMIPCRISTIATPHHASLSSKILSIFSSHNLEFKENDMTFEHYAKLLKFLNIDVKRTGIDLFTNEMAERKAEFFLRKGGLSETDFLIAVCPTAGNKLKEWGAKNWISLSNLLIDSFKAKIILVGAPGDSDIISEIRAGTKNRAVDSSRTFNLDEIPAFFKKIKLCVTSINAPMHIADGVGVPIVAIVGPCNFRNQPPIGERTKIVYHPLYCHPCDFFTKTSRSCKEGHHRCIKETMVDEVYGAIIDLKNKFKL